MQRQKEHAHLIESFHDRQTASAVEQMNRHTEFLSRHPKILGYFERSPFEESPISPEKRDQMLLERFKNATPEERNLVLIGCEMLADFMESLYTQKNSIATIKGDWQVGSWREGEWNLWWNYCQDAYDETPCLRKYFEFRDDWYSVDDVLRDPELRKAAYEGEKFRRNI